MKIDEAIQRLKTTDACDSELCEALDMAIKALEQEPCGDVISRDKVIVQLNHLLSDWDDDWNVAIRKCIETLKIVPSVTPQPKMGRWSHDGSHWENRWICSECGYKLIDMQTNYCPNCGSYNGGEG